MTSTPRRSATMSRSASPRTSTRGTCGSPTRCPRARPARSSSARSRYPSRRSPPEGHRRGELWRTRRSRRAAHGRRGRAAVAIRATARHRARGGRAGPASAALRPPGSRPRRGAGPRGRRALRPQTGEGRPALRRPRLGVQLGVPPHPADVPVARRDRRLPGHRRGGRLARRASGPVRGGQRRRRAGADELPVVEPDGVV